VNLPEDDGHYDLDTSGHEDMEQINRMNLEIYIKEINGVFFIGISWVPLFLET
jgi:hypothetical protein